jgi:hypothetical protein
MEHDDRLVLSELLNHVLDKGVVITGDVTIAIAGIELVRAGLSLYLTSVETLEGRGVGERTDRLNDAKLSHDLSLLPGERGS